MESENIKKLTVIFPHKENKRLNLEIDFGAPVFDLIETLENYLSVGEAATIKLYKSQDENPQNSIKPTKTLADQEVLPGETLYGFVAEKDFGISFTCKETDKTTTFKLTDKMTKLKDIKKQIFVELGLNSARQYDFMRVRGNIEMKDDHTFENFEDLETVQIRERFTAGCK